MHRRRKGQARVGSAFRAWREQLRDGTDGSFGFNNFSEV